MAFLIYLIILPQTFLYLKKKKHLFGSGSGLDPDSAKPGTGSIQRKAWFRIRIQGVWIRNTGIITVDIRAKESL